MKPRILIPILIILLLLLSLWSMSLDGGGGLLPGPSGASTSLDAGAGPATEHPTPHMTRVSGSMGSAA